MVTFVSRGVCVRAGGKGRSLITPFNECGKKKKKNASGNGEAHTSSYRKSYFLAVSSFHLTLVYSNAAFASHVFSVKQPPVPVRGNHRAKVPIATFPASVFLPLFPQELFRDDLPPPGTPALGQRTGIQRLPLAGVRRPKCN